MQACMIMLATAILLTDALTIAHTIISLVYMHLTYTLTGAYFLSNLLHSNERKYITCLSRMLMTYT